MNVLKLLSWGVAHCSGGGPALLRQASEQVCILTTLRCEASRHREAVRHDILQGDCACDGKCCLEQVGAMPSTSSEFMGGDAVSVS